jgi:hypothetical protein
MRAVMRVRSIASAALAVPSLALLAAACGPANYPDTPAVVAAQAKWCEALAKMSGHETGWEPMSACKAATPAASAAFIRGMTKCLPEQKAAGGDKSVDMGLLVASCRDDVLLHMPIDEAVAKPGIEARCDRATRCEKAVTEECLATAGKLEASQRATLYGIYNGAAFEKIGSCLRSTTCTDDENKAQSDCYKPLDDKLLWFP